MAKRGGYPGGMPNNMNMNNRMKQAQKMQRQMEEAAKELETKEYTATAGGGAIEVTVSGQKKLTKVVLEEEIVDPIRKTIFLIIVLSLFSRVCVLSVSRQITARKGGRVEIALHRESEVFS